MATVIRERFRAAYGRMPPPLRTWTKRIALGLAIAYVAYLVLGNLFINTPLGPWAANRKPEKFQIDWGPGLTWWPGYVAIWDVRMQGHVGRTVWAVQAGKAQGHVSILPLLRKEVRVPLVVADEVSGGADLVEQRIPPPPTRPGGWTLRFDRIVSDTVLGGHFAQLQLQGKGRAEVGFRKQMRGGAMELLPSQAHFAAARLGYGKQELLRDLAIDANFAIAAHTHAQASGARTLLLTDAKLSLDGNSVGLQVTPTAQGRPVFAVAPGQGKAHARIDFARGALRPGSQLRLDVPMSGTDGSGQQRTQALQVALDAGQDITLKAAMPKDSGLMKLDADLRVRGTELPLQDMRSLVARSSGHVVGKLQLPSLHWLSGLVDAPWLSLEGSGMVDIDARIADGKVASGSRIGVPEVAAVAHVMGNRIQGRARAEARIDVDAQDALRPSLDLVMEQFNIAADDAPARPYVEGSNLRLHLGTEAGLDRQKLRQQLDQQTRQPRAAAQVRDELLAHLTFDDARVPDLRAYNRYLPAHLRFTSGSGLLSGDLRIDGKGDIGAGRLRVKGKDSGLQLAGMDLRGNLDVDVPLRRASLSQRNFDIDGSRIRLDGIAFTEPGGESRSGWWANIELDRARMDWDKPISVDGHARIAMKDVGFLLSLFSRQREYPKWVYKLIDDGQAKVVGSVQWKRDTLVLDRVDASNQRYDLKARLRLQGKQRVGSLYAKWGVLSCAVAVNNGQRDFHMVKARQWYDSQPDLLR